MDPTTTYPATTSSVLGHAVSVLVLVEDSQTMLGKWDDVRHRYLPALLHGLRADNKTSPQFRIWWFTSCPSFTPLTTTITTLADYNNLPNLNLGRQTDTLISTSTIRRCLNVYLGSGKHRRTNQHLIIVAASPLLTGSEWPSPVQTGIDPWVGTALALCQEEIHLHLIVGPANESRSFRDLFSRTRFAQTLSEIPPWFEVDSTRFSILISGRSLQQPQPLSSSWSPPALVPLLDTHRRSPETSLSPSASSPVSPTRQVSPTLSRPSSFSATSSPRTEDRTGQQTRSTIDSLGLVGFLQRMHGLTKKRSYGAKSSKRPAPLVEGQVPGRPILPRLDLSAPYPRPPVRTSDSVPASPVTSPTHQSSPAAERPSSHDRQPRSRATWQPLSPPSIPPASPVSDSTAAALRSLEAMMSRPADTQTTERSPTEPRPPPGRFAGRGAQILQALAYSDASSVDFAGPGPQASSPDSGSTSTPVTNDLHQRPAMLDRSISLDGASYYTTMSQTSQTTSESSAGSVEDQPFIVTPEYEAFVAARFEEAVRSGAMQASMTSSLSSALSAPSSLSAGDIALPRQEMQSSLFAGQQVSGTQGTGAHATFPYDPAQYPGVMPQTAFIGGQWNSEQGYSQDVPQCGGPSATGWHAQ